MPLTITGTNASEFSIITPPTSPIAAGSFSDMVVRFAPTSTGAKSALISIGSNDSDENPCTVNLAGTGTGTPSLQLQQPANTPQPCGFTYDFGTATTGGASQQVTVTVANTGGAPLNITNTSITGSTDFAITTAPSSPIAPSSTSTLVVTYTPTLTGAQTATVTITSNDPTNPTCTVVLTAAGEAPLTSEIQLQYPGTTNVACGGATVTFGNTPVGSTSTQTFRIANLGAATLNIASLVFGGSSASEFALQTSAPTTVAPGAFVDVVVVFTPASSGAKTAFLTINNDDGDEPMCGLNLGGTGTEPDINVVNQPCGSTATFTSVQVGDNTSLTFTIQNTGQAALNLTTPTVTGAHAGDFTITAMPSATVAAGSSTTLTVQFAPTAAGTRTAQIDLTSNDPDENPCSLNLAGEGLTPMPEIQLQSPVGTNVACGATGTFSATNVGSSASLTFRLRNTGFAPLNLTNTPLTVTGTHAAEFTITSQPVSPIAAGGFADVTVQFSPADFGARTASISIANDDADENPCVFNLSGTGNAPDIQVEQPSGTIIECGNGMVDFGSVQTSTATTRTFTVRNNGNTSLSVTTPLSASGSTEFSITTQPASGTVAANGTVTFVVQFLPTSTGAKTATISLASNDPNESACVITLNGTATAPLQYRSAQSGAWNQAATWETSVDGATWSVAAAAPATISDVVTIRANNTVTISSAITVDQVVISTDGTLDITTGTLTVANGAGTDISVFGTLKAATSITISSGAAIVFEDGGRYQHNFSGAGPIPSSTWNTGSTCEILATSSAYPAQLNQSYWNFTWNATSQSGTINFDNNLRTINGDFTVSSTGNSGAIRLGGSNGSTLSIGGKLRLQGGTLDLNNGSGITTINLNGSLELIGGTLTTATPSNGTNLSKISFSGTSEQFITRTSATISGQVFFEVKSGATATVSSSVTLGTGTFSVLSGGTVNLQTNTITVPAASTFSVASGGTVNLGTGTIAGTGTFSAAAGATVRIGSPAGIVSAGTASGNVQTTTRTFNAGANYEYNGAAAQVTGTGLPTSLTGTATLTINNPSGVALTNNLVLGSATTLALTAGTLRTNGALLTANGAITGASDANFVCTCDANGSSSAAGGLKRPSGVTSFPVGATPLLYTPVTVTNGGTADDFTVRAVNAVLSDGNTGSPIANGVVNVTWFVDEATVGGSVVQLTVQWPASAETAGFERSSSYVSHYTGGGWSPTTPSAAPGSDPYTQTRSGLSSFSPFSVGSNGILPVRLLDFTATLLPARQARLDWRTASETDNAYFDLERSTDGVAFQPIGRVTGGGTTQGVAAYRFVDVAPAPGLNYYRLRQVDSDGAFTYSPIVSLRVDGEAATVAHVYPSPVTDRLTVRWNAPADGPGFTGYEIYDAQGRLAQRGALPPDAAQTELDVATLPAGTYVLRLLGAQRGAPTAPFVKQ